MTKLVYFKHNIAFIAKQKCTIMIAKDLDDTNIPKHFCQLSHLLCLC